MKTNKPEVVAIKDSDVGGLIELKPVLGLPHGTRLICLTDYERLQAECERLRKDAERYQFVRTRVSASNARGPASWAFHYYQLPKPISNPLAGPPAWVHFDAAIDAAMEEIET